MEIFNNGVDCFKNGEYLNAIEKFTVFLNTIPTENKYIKIKCITLGNRSSAFAYLNNFKQSLKDSEECIKIDPDYARGYLRKGIALEGLHCIKEAANLYIDSLKYFLNKPPIKYNKKSCEDMKKRFLELNKKVKIFDENELRVWRKYDENYCAYCQKFEDEIEDLKGIKWENNIKCYNCELVNYCSENHKIKDYEIHKNYCKSFKTAKTIYSYKDIENLPNVRTIISWKNVYDNATNWNYFWNIYIIDIPIPSISRKYYHLLLENHFTYPLTIYYCLKKNKFIDKNIKYQSFPNHKYLNIHIIGAEDINESNSAEAFIDVLGNISPVGYNFTFIGPLLSKRSPINRFVNSITFYRGLYHEFIKTSNYKKPDIIFAFHSGIHDMSYTTWIPTINYNCIDIF